MDVAVSIAMCLSVFPHHPLAPSSPSRGVGRLGLLCGLGEEGDVSMVFVRLMDVAVSIAMCLSVFPHHPLTLPRRDLSVNWQGVAGTSAPRTLQECQPVFFRCPVRSPHSECA